MSNYSVAVDALSPVLYYRMGDASSPLTEEVASHNATCYQTPGFEETGALFGDTDTAVSFNSPFQAGVFDYAAPSQNYDIFRSATEFSVSVWVNLDSTALGNNFFDLYGNTTQWITLGLATNFVNSSATSKAVVAMVRTGSVDNIVESPTELTTGTWYFITMRWNAGVLDLFIDGTQVATNTETQSAVAAGIYSDLWIARSNGGGYWRGTLDELSFFPTALTDAQIEELYQVGDTGAYTPAPDSIPMTLTGSVTGTASSLPMRLITATQSAAGSMGMLLESPDSTHYLASAARWGIAVELDGADVSGSILDFVTIENEEDSSSLCEFLLLPADGSVDPDDYERKPVHVSFIGLDSGGSELYTSRRFTGITSSAIYDPDAGILSISATNDLQGRLENLPRAAIDTIVGGLWSEHVFDDSADGWQYSQDRLSTALSEIHVNNYGQLVSQALTAKATQDVTLTDTGRFNDTLRVVRANRRDLLSRVRVNFDFRFVRLRHREMSVNFADSLGFCSYLNNGWTLPNKSMVIAAADSNEWVRTSDVTFTELPAAGTYCTPSRGWVGGADQFCLAAQWTAARRWAQTVTEEYALDVIAPDVEESIGRQEVNEDYGIEASYDGADYENVKGYDDRPTGSTLSIYTDDWQKDATDSEESGRTAMESAQECALERAKALILKRARKNRVYVEPIYDPSISLASTVRVNTPYLTAKGKVSKITERLDLLSGEATMGLELAISRHGGSGLASDDPIVAPDEPAQPQEETSARVYTLFYRLGGLAASPADDETWDGYMTNVSAAVQDVGAELYRERFVVKMPAIEDAARDATSVPQTSSYEVAVPQDELTLSK